MAQENNGAANNADSPSELKSTGSQKKQGGHNTPRSIKDITISEADFPIVVRVLRLFDVKKIGSPDVFSARDMILIDKTGYKINCWIKQSLMDMFQHIKEGHTYEVRHFGVAFNCGKLRYTSHRFKLTASRETVFKAVNVENIDRYGFTFVDFPKINERQLDERICVDVIGILKGIGEILGWKKDQPTKSARKEGTRLKVELIDMRENIVHCVFWDSYAEFFRPYLGCTSNDAVVVLIQLGKYGTFNSGPQVSNGFNGTRIYINDDSIPAIVQYRERFKEIVGEGVTVSRISSEVSRTASDIFLNPSERMKISDIFKHLSETQKPFKAVSLATVEHIEDRNGWYYNSCRSCKRKVEKDATEKYWCKQCTAYEEYSTPCFFIQCTIGDESGSYDATIFDTAAIKYFNKTVTDILDMQPKDTSFNVIPPIVNELLNKTMLFSLSISEYNVGQLPESSAYTVSYMTEDRTLIKEFEKLSNLETHESEETRTEIYSTEESSETPSKRPRIVDVENDQEKEDIVQQSTTRRKTKKDKQKKIG